MAYGLIYTLPFSSLGRTAYRLEIEKEGYAGESKELTGTPAPFVVAINDSDFIYEPLRLSTATIGIVGGNELQRLFATGWQEYRVTLIRKTTVEKVTTETVVWCGFVRPEEYTQDYSSELFSLDVEVQSAVSVLEQIKYETQNTDGLKYVTVKSLIERALAEAQARWRYIYIPHTWAVEAAKYGENALLRADCMITEQNFFDEENTPMTYLEILEQICRFAHWTLCDWMGDVWFVDWDYTDSYDRYVLAGGTLTMSQQNAVSRKSKSVQDIGYHGAAHTLDILGGYNKARIRTSNYSCGDKVFPDEDFESLPVLLDKRTEQTIHINIKRDGNGTHCDYRTVKGRVLYVAPNKWQPHVYISTGKTESGVDLSRLRANTLIGAYYYNNGNPVVHAVTEVDVRNYIGAKGILGALSDTVGIISDGQTIGTGIFSAGYLWGATMARYCNWQINEDGRESITSYNYEDVIFLKKVGIYADDAHSSNLLSVKHDTETFNPGNYNGLFNYAGHLPTCAYADGAIGISLQAVPICNGMPGYRPDHMTRLGMATDGYYYAGENYTFEGDDYFEPMGDKITFTMLLRIGDKYWNGTSWQTGKTTFTVDTEKVQRAGAFVGLYGNKTLDMPYDGLDGHIAIISEMMQGELYFSIMDVNRNCAIKDLKLQFQIKEDYETVEGAESDGGDRIYSNVVNEKFINELDTIEEKISSYNHDGLCFGKVLLNGDYIKGNIYNGVTRQRMRPENLLLRRIINQYEVAKTKLSQVLLYAPDLQPCDLLTDKATDGKRFAQTGGEIRFADDEVELKMIDFA